MAMWPHRSLQAHLMPPLGGLGLGWEVLGHLQQMQQQHSWPGAGSPAPPPPPPPSASRPVTAAPCQPGTAGEDSTRCRYRL